MPTARRKSTFRWRDFRAGLHCYWIVFWVVVFQSALVVGSPAKTPGEERALFTNSITPMPPKVASTVRGLRREHLGKTMEIEIPLQMRDYPKLLEKIGRGLLVSHAEMESNYLPLKADYDALLQWLTHEGFRITQTDPNRLSVFARGSAAQIQQALQVELVQVTVDGVDYHTARTHPSLPRQIAKPVLGINGLQPYLHLHKHTLQPAPNINDKPPYVVKEILDAYDAQNLGVTGSNQKIAILIDTVPKDSDLTSFWSFNNIPQTLSNIEKVNVIGGALPAPSGEETLDVEWSSGIAPSAKVRIYASGSLSFTNLDKSLQRIISDLPNQPQMHQLSISLGLGESYLLSSSQMQTDAQFFATIASSGVSVFVSSGDAGSNPDSSGQSSSGPLQVEYYSSDPSVTGVGGTNLTLNTSTGTVVSESGWSGSGGGVSQYFSRPGWQTGSGVVAGTKRLVPDVSLVASDSTYAYFYYGGKGSGVAGTSWSAPTWAGFCALLNESRANVSQSPLGLLNPRIYPLLGTANFRDIASGNNGHYNAGSGYDMVTGLGVPSMATLLQTLAGLGSGTPAISSFSPTSGAVNATVTISGGNLGRVTAVNFNGISASFTVDSATQITATVPSGATTGPISITATPGGTAVAPSNFTVLSGVISNDNFANASTVSGTSGSVTASNVGATKETGEPNHAGNPGGASVWYTWTAPEAGTYTFDTFGSSFDTLLAIYTGGAVNGLTPIASNDDAGTGVSSSVSFVATAGTVYQIAVDGHDGQSGTLALNWILNSAAPAINSFTPATGAPRTVVAIDGANFTGATSVKFNGISAQFNVISSTQITATVPTGATTGVLTLATPSGTSTSAAVFTVLTPPSNDDFANAIILSGSSGTVTGVNVAATKESGEPNHSGNVGGASVWYSWTAPASSSYTLDTAGSSFDTLLAVYTGSGLNALTQVAANDDFGGGVSSSVSFNAVAGTVYWIAVDGFGGATGNLVLSWVSNNAPPLVDSFTPASGPVGTSVIVSGSSFTGAFNVTFNGTAASFVVNSDTEITTTVPPGATSGAISISNLNGSGESSSNFEVTATPVNDNFAHRITIAGSGGTVGGSNSGATKEIGEPSHAGNSGGKSVWWTWTAPSTGKFIVSTLGSDFDTLLGIYTGSSISALKVVASNDDDPNGGVTSSLVLNATAGTVYQIAVDGLNGASGRVILTLTKSNEPSLLYSTGFESSEGFSTATPLAGQPAATAQPWRISGSNGNGILSNSFSGLGQQAYLGFTHVDDQTTFLWRPVNFTPSSGDVVTFSVAMKIVDSRNGYYDDFQWEVYNSNGDFLFALDFDNSTWAIGYFLGDNVYHDTGASFTNSTKYNLQVSLDFGKGTWSATLNGAALVADQPLSNSTPAAKLDLGDIDAVWGGSNTNNYLVMGDNYLVFDNYIITKTSPLLPQIVLQPQSGTAKTGDNVSLTVASLGSAPLTYQWQKNGSSIDGATASTLVLSNVQAADTATYTVSVSNSGGTVVSDPAKITVNNPPPSYTVTTSSSPANGGTTTGGGTFQAQTNDTVSAAPAGGFQFVNWTENGNQVSTAASYRFTLSGNRTLVANFIPDTTAPTVSILLPTNSPSLSTTSNVLNLSGTASDNVAVTRVSWSNSQGGSGNATGTTAWSINGIALQQGINLLTVTAYDAAGNSATAELQVTYKPPVNFSLLTGAYNGLLETTGSTGSFIGLARINLNAKGSFTGTIWFQGMPSGIHGTFAPSGAFSSSIIRSGKPALVVTMNADTDNPDVLTGTVTDGTTPAAFTADRSVFNALTNPCPYAGRYTMVFKSSQDPGSPQGQGIGAITVNANGVVHLIGKLADGTNVSQGGALTKNAVWPLFLPLYSGTGYIAGPQTFGDARDISGVLDWLKPKRPDATYFPNGFQSRLTTMGKSFTTPGPGATVIRLGVRTLTLKDTDVQMSKSVGLNPPSSLAVLNPGPDRLSLNLSVGNGMISGKFLVDPASGVWTSLHAVILQGQDEASGFFLENHQSGDLEMTPAP